VILVADQFRADYLDRYQHRWRAGIRTLLDEGARFTRAEYPYLYPTTCAGHATIATGALPRTHGIVLNRWWQREERRAVACTSDDDASIVSYGGAGGAGSSAKRLRVPTVAELLQRHLPAARVVALSLKSRSAIPLAGTTPTVVTWFEENARAFVTSRAFAPSPVPAVRDFIARDPPEGDLGRTWTLSDRGETYRFGDLGIGERPKSGWTSMFPHPLGGTAGNSSEDGGPTAADAQFFDRWQKSPYSDAYLGRMAASLVDDLQLGQRDATDYLAVSFSALDLLAHDFGPDSREVEDLLIRLDLTIGALIDRLDARVGRDNYVIALTADHGGAPMPERSGGGHIANEDLGQVVEQTLIALWGEPSQTPYVVYVGSGSLFLADGVFDRLRADASAMRSVTRALEDVPGVMRVLRRDSLSDEDDAMARRAAAGSYPDRSGDLLVVPRRHWVLELRTENEATNHGSPHDYDRRIPLLLRGHRIRAGRYDGRVSPADIAPTLAHLAGVSMPSADGRVLTEAVR
jgi:predicted AlkP superfamily pyrophosphatase or phosphodiesterase